MPERSAKTLREARVDCSEPRAKEGRHKESRSCEKSATYKYCSSSGQDWTPAFCKTQAQPRMSSGKMLTALVAASLLSPPAANAFAPCGPFSLRRSTSAPSKAVDASSIGWIGNQLRGQGRRQGFRLSCYEEAGKEVDHLDRVTVHYVGKLDDGQVPCHASLLRKHFIITSDPGLFCGNMKGMFCCEESFRLTIRFASHLLKYPSQVFAAAVEMI